MNGSELYIGIDPDLDRNGVAIWESQNGILTLKNLSFWQLYDLLSTNRDRIVVVRIEAGWLNFKSNWHNRYRQTKEAGEAISRNVGENHAVGKLISQMCTYLEILHEEVRPTASKVDAKLFKSITGFNKSTNQEQRDAAMLIHSLMN
jgi:hypothetical protein